MFLYVSRKYATSITVFKVRKQVFTSSLEKLFLNSFQSISKIMKGQALTSGKMSLQMLSAKV